MNVIDSRAKVNKIMYVYLKTGDVFIMKEKVCIKIDESYALVFDEQWKKLEIVDNTMTVDRLNANLVINNYTECQGFLNKPDITLVTGRNSLGY